MHGKENMDSRRIALEGQIQYLISNSRDACYTEYLQMLLLQLGQQNVTVEYISYELNRTYQMYVQRVQAYDMQQQRYVQQVQNLPPQYTAQQQYTSQPQYAVQQQYIQQPQHIPVQYAQQPQYVPQMQYQYVQQPQYTKREKKARKRKNIEASIGVGVFSVIGVLFILISFVMLGQTYMNSLMKGICLYGIALAMLLVSELVIKRKMPYLSVGITGLGICGLYFTNILNCLYLQNFDGWWAVAATVLVTLIAAYLSKKKGSGVINGIGFLGCYISIYLLGNAPFRWIADKTEEGFAEGRFLVTAAALFFANLTTIFLTVKKHRTAMRVIHMSANALFTVFYTFLEAFNGGADYVLFYLISSLLVQGLLFYLLIEPNKEKTDKEWEKMVGGIALYAATNVVLILIFFWESLFVSAKWHIHAAMGCFLPVCAVLFYLFRKSSLKWIQFWMYGFTAVVVYNRFRAGGREDGLYWWCLGVTIGIFLISRFLSRIKLLWISDIVITLLTALTAAVAFVQKDWLSSLCYLAAFLVSMAGLHHWKELYEGIFLIVLEAFVPAFLQNELTISVMFAILFLGVLGFHGLAFFKGQYNKIFNYVSLGFMACLCLAALFYNSFLSVGFLLALGAAFMFLAFRDEYGMNFRFKKLIFLCYLCYMILIWDIPIPIIKSILMMLAAIGAVVAGFAGKEKNLRISGLILTLLVCGKIVLFDFAGAATMEKMLLFLIAGIIVLAISSMYIALEKKIV